MPSFAGCRVAPYSPATTSGRTRGGDPRGSRTAIALSPDATSTRRPLLAVIGTISGVLLGGVLLTSAYSKAIDPRGFGESMVRDGLMPAVLAFAAAVLVIAIEAGVGVALVAAIRRPLVLTIATVMMTGFLGLAVWTWLDPPAEASGCGCFGNLMQQTPGQKAALNVGFLLLALGAWIGRPRGLSARWLAVPAPAFTGALAFALAAPGLPIDGWPGATTLSVGARADALGLVDSIPELDSGSHLVLLVDRADERTRLDIARVNEALALVGGPVSVWGLAEENPELEMEFFFAAGPAFDVRSAPYPAVKPLYRALPRAFTVEDGIVTRVWDAIPSEADLSALAEGRQP